MTMRILSERITASSGMLKRFGFVRIGAYQMLDKTWKKMGGWEKTEQIATWAAIAVGVLAMCAWAIVSEENPIVRRRGGSVWAQGQGGKKPGSWSSFRHG